MSRVVHDRYTDPLDAVWLGAARDLGWTVRRDDSAYASFDGAGTLTIATPNAFDADDGLAQMILHEICHALVAGPDGLRRGDWGLENADDRDLLQEHATHRLQAHLAQRWGLRDFFAVTTDWRPYWDALPREPLARCADPAVPLAQEGLGRAETEPWRTALRRAFAATRIIISAAAPVSPPDSLLRRALPARAHPLGGPCGADDQQCGGCAWFAPTKSGDGENGRCLMWRRGLAPAPRTAAATVACLHWEPRLADADCLRCGACCREAFDAVPVERTCSLHITRPTWIRRDIDGFGPYLPRPNGRCVALAGEGPPWLCTTYAERPRSCRDFAVNSGNCLEARRRVGLSPRPL